MDLVVRAADGHGGGLTVVGEPGIGKTAVLDEAADLIACGRPDARIVRLRGVESEVELPWSGLAGLLDDFLGGLGRLAPARARAVRSALSLGGTSSPVEPFAVALGTRDLLVEAAERGPVVVLADDLPWIDPATRRTLSYITRRLQFERVAVVSTRRAGSDSVTDTGPAVSLDAVTDEVADGILADAGVDSMNVRHELVAACGGVPLVLVEAAKLLDAEQRAGLTALPNPLPIGASGHRVVDWRLERLPPSALAALLIAAAEPDGDLVHIMHALATQNLGVAGLELAEDQRLVTLDGDRLSFRHPLIRSAVYHDASATARRAAHRALADTLPDASPARAWHGALASGGPDEEVARALDDAAAVTNRRGAPAVAGRSWELASRLSPAVEDRVRRLRLAADAVLDAGMAAAAGRLLERADEAIAASPHADDPVERVRRQQLRCRLPPSIGGAANPVATLRAAAREVASTSPSVAVDLLLDALAAYIREGALADMADTVEEAVTLRDLVDEDRARRIDVIYGALLISRAQPDGERLLDRYLEMAGPARSVDALFLAEVLAPALAFLRRTDAFDALLAELETDLRTRGAVRPLVSVIGAQSMAHYSRSFPASLAAATEAVALAESTGFPELASFAAAVLALCSAVIGDRQSCERAAQLLSDVPEPERRALGPFALGYLAYNQGRYEDADAHFRQVEEISPIGRGLIRWEIEWIETLIRSGRLDDAARVLCALESEVSPRLLRVHGIGRAKGMLATDDATAARHFADDVAIAVRLGNRFYEGRAEHLWGERLRRARRRAEAREHLGRAVQVLRDVGATTFADHAANELRAAGGIIGDDVATHRLLSPHELQVARLVVAGASNRDLAATLFLSPRTVEAHLTGIFRKLGVSNRRELAARAIDDPILQP